MEMDMRIFNMDANGNGKRGLPKLRDIIRRQRQDSDSGPDCPDLDFVYDDADCHTNEIAELYSYTEQSEFQLNVKAFEDQMYVYSLCPTWQKLTVIQKKSVIAKLLNQLEVSDKSIRMQTARTFLYLAQGCWAEVQSDKEQISCSKENIIMLYEHGVFHAFVELLNIEIDNSVAASTAMRKFAVSLAESTDLRIILSFLYIIVEVMRSLQDEESENLKHYLEAFRSDLGNPIGDEILVVKLFGMVTRFCSGSAPHFPMKKVLLLLWKTILVSLGGIDTLRQLKWDYRQKAGLETIEEDTIEVVRNMRASSPPASAVDLLETQNQKRNNRPLRPSLLKQRFLEEPTWEALEQQESDELIKEFVIEEPEDVQQPSSPRPQTPTPIKGKRLPWVPKVRQKDLDTFLENTRIKFVGFPLKGDRESLFGLPQPIHEGVRVLKQHVYRSLAEVQVQLEEELAEPNIQI